MQKQFRAIIEGAITNVVYFIFLVLALYSPLSIMAILLPIPFVVYTRRQSVKWVLVTSIFAVFISFLIGNYFAVLLSLTTILPGIVIGTAYRRDLPAGKVLLAGTLVNLFFNLVLYWIAKSLYQFDILDQFLKAMDEMNQMAQVSLDGMLKTLPPDQNNPQNIQQINDMKQIMADQTMQGKNTMVTIFPSFFILSSFIQTWFIHALSRQVLQRLGIKVKGLPQLKDLRFPRWVLYYYSIVLFISLFPDITQYPFLHKVSANGSFLLTWVLLMQGIAAVVRYSMKRGWNKGVISIVLILIILLSLYFILVIIGIIELLFELIRNRFSEK